MITVRVAGELRLREQLRLLALAPNERRSILRKIGREIAKRLKKAIRRQVRTAQAGTFASRDEQRRKARKFAALVKVRATSREVVIFDKGAAGGRQGEREASEKQARRLRTLGFRLSVAYIRRNFSSGLAGMLIRELETETGGARERRSRRGSLVLMVWRRTREQILAGLDIPNIIRRELAV